MNKAIYKYPFGLADSVQLSIPKGYRILSVQVQNGIPCLWCEVTPDANEEKLTLLVRGTGHTFQGNEGQFIGTIQMNGGQFVFHVYRSL